MAKHSKRTMGQLVLGILLLGSLCTLGMGAGPAAAWQRVVGQAGTPCPNAQYTTITAAINAANPGDEIVICPALYDEQLVITKPLKLRGLSVNGIARVLIQPSSLTPVGSLGFEAVIAVLNTHDVTIDNLAVDASKNAVTGCTPGLAAIHFRDASGTVQNSAIFGAQLAAPGCTTALPFGNGVGVQVDADEAGPFHVLICGNSIHDFTANGVLAVDAGVKATITDNNIVGVGPSGGVFQFGVFIVNGAVGVIQNNVINEGNCGALSITACIPLRSEGITLRAVGDWTVVENNFISKAQSGIFVNGARHLRVTGNIIGNIDAFSGMDLQGTASGYLTDSQFDWNTIYNVGPIDANASNNEEGCGINEYSGTGVSGNTISHNTINDAYCGVASVAADEVSSTVTRNTLYATLDSDLYPTTFPPATEP
jgi:hypothetical protein